NQPISIIFCIQTNTAAGPALAKLPKVSGLILPLVAGEGGHAAVLTYSDKVTLLQEFTSDGNALSVAFQRLRPDGRAAHMLDAVDEALRLLDARPRAHRKVAVFIGEAKDRSSEAKLENVLQRAARSNVTIYPVSFSVFLTPFTTRERYQPSDGNLITG